MVTFLQIFLSNIVLIMVLITIHEIGHWFMGRVAGIPTKSMKIQLLMFPQQVMLRDGEQWKSVATDFDSYNATLMTFLPSRSGRIMYVVGGFLFESCFIVILTFLLARTGFWLFALVAPGASLMMYLIYLFVMDLPQVRKSQHPWGDTSILYSIAPSVAIIVAVGMVLVRIVLCVAVALKVL